MGLEFRIENANFEIENQFCSATQFSSQLSIILIDRDPDLGTPSLSIILPSIAAAALLLLWIVVVIEMKLITNKLIYYDIKCD